MDCAGATTQEGALLECLYFSRLRRRDLVGNGLGDWEWLGAVTQRRDIAVKAILGFSTTWVSGYQASLGPRETPVWVASVWNIQASGRSQT